MSKDGLVLAENLLRIVMKLISEERFIVKIKDNPTIQYVESAIGNHPDHTSFTFTELPENAGRFSRSTSIKYRKVLRDQGYLIVIIVSAS